MRKKILSASIAVCILLSVIAYGSESVINNNIEDDSAYVDLEVSEITTDAENAEDISKNETFTESEGETYIEVESECEICEESVTNTLSESETVSEELEVATEAKMTDNIELVRGSTKRFIIKYKPDANKTAILNSNVYSLSKEDNTAIEERKVCEDMAVIEFEEGVDEDSFIEQADNLLDMDSIEYIQPDYEISLSAYSEEEITEGIAIQLEKNKISQISTYDLMESCIVAVIDTGFDPEHPFFADRVFTNTEETENNEDTDLNGCIDDTAGWNFCDNNNEVYNTEKSYEYNHGTHVAGIIAQSSNAQILNIKAFKNGKAYTSDVVAAIHYAESMGAQIINCSFGTMEENRALMEAVEESNALFICAAGNGRINIDETPVYPAAYRFDNVISVASMNDHDGISYFSNYGMNNVDIAAYGENIYSSYTEGRYGKYSGTSMAAAFVSGVAASLFASKSTSAADVKNQILICSDQYSSIENKVGTMRKLNAETCRTASEVNEVTNVYYNEAEIYPLIDTESDNGMNLFSVPTISIATGEKCSFLIKEDGSVWVWGTCGTGAACENFPDDRIANPIRLPYLSDVKKICTSDTNTVVLKNDGTVWGWGENSCNQLGYYNRGRRENIPVQIFDAGAIDISVSNNFIMCSYDGYVICSGENELFNDADHGYAPVGDGMYSISTIARDISAGNHYNDMILNETGMTIQTDRKTAWADETLDFIPGVQVVSSGYSAKESLYVDENNNIKSYPDILCASYTEYENMSIAQICNSLYVKGLIRFGNGEIAYLKTEIGHYELNGAGYLDYIVDISRASSNAVEMIPGVSDIVAISVGKNHYMALSTNGDIYCWGDNTYGQCGVSDVLSVTTPQKVFETIGWEFFSVDNVEIYADDNEIVVNTSYAVSDEENTDVAIKICDRNGKIVYVGQQPISNSYTINMPEKSSGRYMLYVRMDGDILREYPFVYGYHTNDVVMSNYRGVLSIQGKMIDAADKQITIKLEDSNGNVVALQQTRANEDGMFVVNLDGVFDKADITAFINIVGSEMQYVLQNSKSVSLQDGVYEEINPELYKALKHARPELDSDDNGVITEEELASICGTLILSESNISNIEGLQYCTNITTLYIDSNRIADISPLASLPNLTALFAQNNLIGDISGLPRKLEILNLSNNFLNSVGIIRTLGNLKAVYLDDNYISEISFISGTPNLKYLSVKNNNIISIYAASNAAELLHGDFSDNKIISVAALADLNELRDLRLSNNDIVDIKDIESNSYDYLYIDGNSQIIIHTNIDAVNLLY